MSSCITAIGTANPGYKTPQNEIQSFMVKAFGLSDTNARRLAQIYEHSGIATRFSVLPDFGNPEKRDFFDVNQSSEFPGTAARMKLYQEHAPVVAEAAVKECLKASEGIKEQITHLITVSCTGMYAPGIDIELIERLQLKRDVERTCINFMGCYGAVNALKSADYICRSDKNARVLIVCVELCTIHFQKADTLDNWVANSLFSDGAAAVLVENVNNRSLSSSCLEIGNFHSEFIPEARDEMGWYIGDTGFEMILSSKVPRLIKKHLAGVTESLLSKSNLKLNDIGHFAIHPGGRKILEAAEEALNFDAVQNRYAYEVLNRFGNMSSPTILFVLKAFLDEQISSGKIMSMAFGPGLTVESLVLNKQNA